jgi:RecB family exonuclease
MRRFEPVPFPEGARTDRASMTLLRHYDNCERSAYLYLKHDGGVGSHPMRRGSALHRVLQLLTDAMVENGEPRVPPELAKAVVDEVLADPAYPCPVAEHDYLRESVYRWADETTFDPGSVIACETLFALEIAGVQVRAKIDRAEVLEDGAVHVVDYKSARALPSYEDVARKRPDGSMAAKAFQLVVYGLALAYGRSWSRSRSRTVPPGSTWSTCIPGSRRGTGRWRRGPCR